MNPSDLLGRSFACECGKTHTVPVRAVIYADSAIRELPAALARWVFRLSPKPDARRITLVADRRTYEAAGRDCEASLTQAGWSVHLICLSDSPHGDPICDDLTRDGLLHQLPPADMLLAVGSGVISDLVKWISCDRKIPYAVVATAASMNGYSSNNIAPAIRGVKRVLSGTVPAVIAAVPAVIAHAPFELTAAGLGDVLAKPVSLADWKMSQLLFGEYFCPLCAQLIRDLEPAYLDHPEAIRAKQPAALQALFEALVYSGVSMTMAGTSSPASGGEHMVSHVLDMTAAVENIRHDYHGRQVGLGTLLACALYERVLRLEAPKFHDHSEPTDAAYWKSLTPIVEEEHVLKRGKAQRAVARLRQAGTWDHLREAVQPFTRPATLIKHCLRTAGAAHRIEDIGCTRERFRAAVLHGHQIRERYTILDLARAVGILPGAVDEIIEEWL